MTDAKGIFLRAIECSSPDERVQLIDNACGDDVALRRRVDALLAAHDDPDSYLERPAARFDVTTTHDGSGSNPSDSSSSHHGRFLPGTKIAGRYRIVSMLGRGGMGEVYRADDLRLGQTVALKFLPPELAKDAKRLEYFHNEVRLARQIAHPNVCRVYDIGEVDGQHFISMEYIDGEDLKTLLHRIGRVPADKGVQIAQQLCAGLAAAHAKGVLHRDLKPANIMIDGQGQVRITDFGLATFTGEGENVVGMSGTPAYMAPEQLLRGLTSIQSDIYSLGLILFEAFTGKPTHTATSLDELRRIHEDSSRPTNPAEVVDGLDSVVCRAILRCLAAEPHLRPRSASELAGALPGGDPLAAALAAGETPSPELVAAAGGHEYLSRRIAWLCVAAIVIGLAAVAMVASKTRVIHRVQRVMEPSVLRYRSAEILERLGCRETLPEDFAYGFDDADERFPKLARLASKESTFPIPQLVFWYRESDRSFNSERMVYHFNGQGPGYVGPLYPEWTQPGMRGVRLDVSGNLIWFRSVTRPNEMAPTEDPDWAAWFPPDVIGFDLNDLTPTGRGDLPAVPTDAIQHWEWPISNQGTLRITAAAYRGMPVYFHVEPELTATTARNAIELGNSALATRVGVSALSICILIGLFFFFRHVLSGRWDHRGALRLVVFFTAIGFVGNILRAHHVSGLWERAIVQLCLGGAFVLAAEVGVYYVAIEPLVRRWWPKLLISWSRLLDGRYSDPRVGADVLFGAVVGVFSGLLYELPFVFTGDIPTRDVDVNFLSGYSAIMGSAFLNLYFGTFAALLVAFTVVVCRLLFRSLWIAAAIPVLLIGYMDIQDAGLGVATGLTIVLAEALLTGTMVRLGLVAAISGSLVMALVRAPISTDPNDFWFGYSSFTVMLVLLIAAFGFVTSTGTRRATTFR